MSRLWDKGDTIDDQVLKFTVGNDHVLDQRLVSYDVLASKAHAKMLESAGYLGVGDAETLCAELDRIAEEHAAGKWSIGIDDEDAHTAIENRLVESCGELGKRIHLGRSRNDQVLVALRLYFRDVAQQVERSVEDVEEALHALATGAGAMEMPGYTHMQRAMPSTVALWLKGYAGELEHSCGTLSAAKALFELNPLGSAAGYGTPGLELERGHTTRSLGFQATHEPVTACQLSRGKAEAALAFSLVLVLQDLGRLAADLCLYSTTEFGFVRLPKSFTTGSSIMPQKRNPDVFELVRGRSAQAASTLTSILAVTAKMPGGYHRDLQLIKQPLFSLIDSALETLAVMSLAIQALEFVPAKLAAAMSPELHAAERAFRLVVEEGVPFRDAYARIAATLSD